MPQDTKPQQAPQEPQIAPSSQEAPWTVQDEVQYGLDLWGKVQESWAEGGAGPSPELAGAWTDFEDQIGMLGFSGEPATGVFRKLWYDIQADGQYLSGEEKKLRVAKQQLNQELQAIASYSSGDWRTISKDVAGYAEGQVARERIEAQIQAVESKQYPEAFGLHKRSALTDDPIAWFMGERKPLTEVTLDRGQAGDHYWIPEEYGKVQFHVEPNAARNAYILRVPTPEMIDGREVIVDPFGERWDLTGYRDLLDDPEVSRKLSRAMKGIPDMESPEMVEEAMSGMPALHGAAAFVSKPLWEGIAGQDEEDMPMRDLPPMHERRRNMATIDPEFTIPAWFDMGDQHDLDRLRWDPAFVRVLREKTAQLYEDGELGPTFSETLLGTAGFLMDFATVNKLLKGTAVGAVRGVGKTLQATERYRGSGFMIEQGAIRYAAQSGATRSKLFRWPLNNHWANTTGSFIAYDQAAAVFDPETTTAAALWHSLAMGSTLTVLSKGIRAARMNVLPMKGLEVLMPRLQRFKGMDPFGKTGQFGSATEFIEAVMGKGSRSKSFSETVTRLGLAGPEREFYGRIVDSFWMGNLMGAYGWAEMQPEWAEYSFVERAGLVARGMTSASAFASGTAFAGHGMLSLRRFMGDATKKMETAEGRSILAKIAMDLGSPPDVETSIRWLAAVEQWRLREPELFGDVEVLDPVTREGRDARNADAADWGRVLEQLGAVDLEVGQDARRAFEEVFHLQAASVAVGDPSPRLVGKLGVQELETMGFKSHAHALRAVKEFLRDVEEVPRDEAEGVYRRIDEVPLPLLRRALDWRAKGKGHPGQAELRQAEEGELAEGDPTTFGFPAGVYRPSEMQLGFKGAREPDPTKEFSSLIGEVQHLPQYRGQTPLRTVEDVARRQRRRSPSLPEALRRLSGTSPVKRPIKAEELKEWFPEGADKVDAIFEGKEGAWGAFERQVRSVRRQQQASRRATRRMEMAPEEYQRATEERLRTHDVLLEREGRGTTRVLKGAEHARRLQEYNEAQERRTRGTKRIFEYTVEGSDLIVGASPANVMRALEGRVKAGFGVREAARRAEIEKGSVRTRALEGKLGLQKLVQALGGLRYEPELQGLYESTKGEKRAPGLSQLVQEPGESKGMSLEMLREHLIQDPAYPEFHETERKEDQAVGHQEILEALETDFDPRAARAAEEAYEAAGGGAADWMSAQAFLANPEKATLQQRARVESGEIEMPADAFERERLFTELYAGDQRFLGMKAEQIEAEVLELRRESAAGAQAPEIRHGMSKDERGEAIDTAGALMHEAHDFLRMQGQVPLEASIQDPAVAHATWRAAHGDVEMRRAVVERAGEETWLSLRRTAQDALEASRHVVREVTRLDKDLPENVKQPLLDGLEALDAQDQNLPIPEEARARLQAAGYLDEHGLVLDRARDVWVDYVHRQAFESWQRRNVSGGETYFHAGFSPALAHGGKFSDLEETGAGKTSLVKEWLGKRARGYLNNHPTALRLVNNWRTFAFGPYFASPEAAERHSMQRWISDQNIAESEKAEGMARVSTALEAVYRANRWNDMSDSHKAFFTKGVEKGWFFNAKRPEDLEKIRPGTGYLFDLYQQGQDVLQELGRWASDAGLIRKKSFQRLAGRYAMQGFIRAEDARESESWNQGQVPTSTLNRYLHRVGQDPMSTEVQSRIIDPALWLTKSVKDESTNRFLFTILEDAMGGMGYWMPESRMRTNMDAYARSRYARSAVPARLVKRDGKTVVVDLKGQNISGEYDARTLRMGVVLQGLRDKMQSQEQHEKGKKPRAGQIEYSSKLDAKFKRWLGEGEDGPIFIRKGIQNELDVVISDHFVVPTESATGSLWGRGAMYWADTWLSWWKGGKTLGRTKHWTLNLLNSVATNHGGRAIPVWDFFTSVFAGRGQYQEAWKDVASYQKFLEHGLPRERPETINETEWARAMRYKQFADSATGGTFVGAALSSDLTGGIHAGMIDRDLTQRSMERLAAADARAGEWKPNETEKHLQAIGEFVDRLEPGVQLLNRKIGKMMALDDPAEHARGQTSWMAMYQLVELGVLKYPAFRNAQREWPNAPFEKVRAYSMARTGDMGNTSALLRQVNRAVTPWKNDLFRSTEGSKKLWAKSAAGFLFKNRFWMWASTMHPLQLRWAVTNPLASFSLAAMGTGLAMLWQRQNESDPDEWQRFMDEIAHSRFGITHNFVDTEADRAAVSRMLDGVEIPGLFGAKVEWGDRLTKNLGEVWSRIKGGDPFVFQAPQRGGEMKASSLSQLVGPWGQVVDDINAVREIHHGVKNISSDGGSMLRTGYERLLGKQGLMAGAAVFGVRDAARVLTHGGKHGESTQEVLADWVLEAFSENAPQIYPGLGALSAEGQHVLENALNDALPFTDILRGISRGYVGETPRDMLQETALYMAWPSRGIYQRPAVSGRDSAAQAIVNELFGGSAPAPGTETQKKRLRSHYLVTRQFETVLADTYERFWDEYPAGAPLDHMMFAQLEELYQHTAETNLPGHYEIEEGYTPKHPMLRMISRQEKDATGLPWSGMQPWLISYARKYFEQSKFQEDGMNMILQAGRRREMGKGMYRAAVANALRDPSGARLLDWWWNQIRGGDLTKMRELGELIWDVREPASGSDSSSTWARVMGVYQTHGVQLPDVWSDRMRTDIRRQIEKDHKMKLMLQGGPAAQNELLLREPAGLELLQQRDL